MLKEIWYILENLKKCVKLKAHYAYKMFLHKNLKNMVNAFAWCVKGDLRKLQMKINYCKWKDYQTRAMTFFLWFSVSVSWNHWMNEQLSHRVWLTILKLYGNGWPTSHLDKLWKWTLFSNKNKYKIKHDYNVTNMGQIPSRGACKNFFNLKYFQRLMCI